MAPRGGRGRGMTGRVSSRGSHQTRTNPRGRIEKNHGRRGRFDVDGDRDMDAGAGRTDGHRVTSSKSSARQSTPSKLSSNGKAKLSQVVDRHLSGGTSKFVFLRVKGLRESKAATNPDGGREALLNFLEKKASFRTRPVAIEKFIEAGPYVLISASEQDAEELLKLNGFLFAGVRLEITEHVDDGEVIPNKALDSDQTRSVRAQLRLALQQRWDKEQKLLRLNALHTDAVLTQLGAFTSAEIARKTFKSLMVLCEHQFQTQRERDESVTSITLADNSIASVGEVGSLAGTFPRLKNLDLRSNQIATMAGLEAWQGKLNELENIYLGGNPLETADPSYMVTLLEWFPRLQHVDDVLVQTPEQIAQRNLPRAIPQNGPLFRDVDGIGQNFLLDFFPLFDNDRYLLATRYYDEGSHFSLAVDTHSARGPNAPAPLPWTSYIKTSRNFVKIKTQHARVQRLLTGAGAIYDCWKAMPQTRHPCIKKEFVRYIADCHPLSGVVDPTKQNPLGCDGLIISIHGEFEEYDAQADKLGKRSFSRTFVLSRGLKDTTPVRVVSDMLSLRAFSPLPNVYAAPDEHETRPVEGLAVDGQRRQAMVAELSKRTGLNAGYSEMCLHQVEWDFEKALVRFEESKARIPPEAWITPPIGA